MLHWATFQCASPKPRGPTSVWFAFPSIFLGISHKASDVGPGAAKKSKTLEKTILTNNTIKIRSIFYEPLQYVALHCAAFAPLGSGLAIRVARRRGIGALFNLFWSSAFRQTKPSATTRAVSHKKKKIVNRSFFILSKLTLFAPSEGGGRYSILGRLDFLPPPPGFCATYAPHYCHPGQWVDSGSRAWRGEPNMPESTP